MQQRKSYHFILVEDSKLDAFIGEKIIRGLGPLCLSLQVFQDPQQALAYIQENADADLGGDNAARQTIVLLDIQMPLMNGFEFIERFEDLLSPEQQARYVINMLSSSINEKDITHAKSFDSVNMFLNKPLKKEMIMAVIDSLGDGRG